MYLSVLFNINNRRNGKSFRKQGGGHLGKEDGKDNSQTGVPGASQKVSFCLWMGVGLDPKQGPTRVGPKLHS